VEIPVIVTLQEKDDCHFMIQIIDNGMAFYRRNILKFSPMVLLQKRLARLVTHSSALFAEIGSNLSAESKGIGNGRRLHSFYPSNLLRKIRHIILGFMPCAKTLTSLDNK